MPVISAVGTTLGVGSRSEGRSRQGAKKGSQAIAPPSADAARDDAGSGDARSAWRTRHLVRAEAAGADLHLGDLAVDQGADDLQIRLPDPAGLVVRVRHVVPEGHALVARVAAVALDRHWSALDQLDARHLGAVTLPVTGLEDPGVAALSGGVPRTDLLEQLVGDVALLHVPHREAAGVERALLRLRDQLLDEGPQLLRLRFRGLDRAVLQQRLRETAHEGELLLARPAQLASGLGVPHLTTPLPVRRRAARRRRRGSAACPNRAPARPRH